jgi:hypothetical protein
MSTSDEHLYRGDPPPASAPPGYPPQGSARPGPPPGYAPQAYAPPAYAPPAYAPPAYAPPAYAPPAYAPPGYPPPGYPPYYGRPTNTTAVLALVMAFVFAPAGLVLGIVARRQIRRTGEEGEGLALAGIVVGGVVTTIFVLFIVFWIIALASLRTTGFS